MAEDIKVPTLGESITEATIGRWLKQVGEAVAEDEPIVELETDKVAMEVNAPVSGVMAEIISAEGDTVEVGAVIAKVDISGKAATVASAPKAAPSAAPAPEAAAAPAPSASSQPQAAQMTQMPQMPMSPAVRKLVGEHNLDAGKIAGTGKAGRIRKGDVLKAVEAGNVAQSAPAQGVVSAFDAGPQIQETQECVPMSRLPTRSDNPSQDGANHTALLTTYDEFAMGAIKWTTVKTTNRSE